MLNVIMHEEEAEVVRVLIKREQRTMKRTLREQSKIKDEDDLLDIARYVDMLEDIFESITTAEQEPLEMLTLCEEVDYDDLAAFIAKEMSDSPFYIPEKDVYAKIGLYLAELLLDEYAMLEKPYTDEDEDEE